MVDRSVVYQIKANFAGWRNEFAQASRDVDALDKKLITTTERRQQTMAQLGAASQVVAPIVAIGAASVAAAANFDQAMSNVQAATHETADNMAALRNAAKEAGAETVFSATEAAGAIENLSKAGISTADILGGGLSGALSLAAAGGLEVGQAAEIAATALTQFKLQGEDVPHVADLLAAGAGKAQGEVTDLAYALQQSGLVASQMGISIEETTGTLAAFASAGLLGSDAGTSFRTMLLRMANPTKEAADLMRQLGISAYDAEGNFVGIESLAGQLQTAFQGQSQATRDAAMATLFGSDAIRAANVLYSQGADGINTWTANVNDAGYAAETAAIRMQNLKGDVEKLQGAIETALIGAGEDSQGSLRGLTQGLTWAVDQFNVLPDGLQNALTGAGGTISNVQMLYRRLSGEQEKTAGTTKEVADAHNTLARDVQNVTPILEENEAALEEQREAAHKTATSFFNLGDSLNDSEVALGDWIAEMEAQAEALSDFENNARRAAKNGLRDGLIAALREAGPEGAMRMQQLANATDSEIRRANKAWQLGQRAIESYVESTTKVPARKTTEIVVDAAAAKARVDQIQRTIDALRDKTVTVTVQQRGQLNRTAGMQYELQRAAGGPVQSPGGPADEIPAWLGAELAAEVAA